jgi:hypothetical protein
VLQYAHRCAIEAVPFAPVADATPEQRLRGFVHSLVRGFLARAGRRGTRSS